MQVICKCKIDPQKLSLNSDYFQTKEIKASSPDFLFELMKKSNKNYPKFYKMDELSQLAFLGATFIFKNSFKSAVSKSIGLLGINSQSSFYSDLEHLKNIENNNDKPRPANFVYTLPNICLAEIAIAYNLKTDLIFLIQENFQMKFFLEQVKLQLYKNTLEYVIGGWVEYSAKTNYNLEFYLIKS